MPLLGQGQKAAPQFCQNAVVEDGNLSLELNPPLYLSGQPALTLGRLGRIGWILNKLGKQVVGGLRVLALCRNSNVGGGFTQIAVLFHSVVQLLEDGFALGML